MSVKRDETVPFKRQVLRALFRVYSWAETLLWTLLNLFPPILRRLAFLVMMREFGRGATVDYGTYIRYPKKVRIGSFTTINRSCRFLPSLRIPEGTITIGSHVAVASGVSFLAAGHDYTQDRSLIRPVRSPWATMPGSAQTLRFCRA